MSKRRKYAHCPNCGQALLAENHYCPHCGQPNHDLRVPIRHLISESIEDIFHFDHKSLRTIRALLFKPGFLTEEFVAGKRVSYVSPIRLYVFLSFLFFLLVNILNSSSVKQESPQSQQNEFKISVLDVSSLDLAPLSDSQIDSLMNARGISRNAISRFMIGQAAKIGRDGTSEFTHRFVKAISYMMFALMPVFALFVFVINRAQTKYYLNSLIFSVHLHSAAFALMTLLFVSGRLFDSSQLILATPLALAVYGLFALKRFAGQSWTVTVLKSMALGVIYLLSLVAVLLLTILASIITY